MCATRQCLWTCTHHGTYMEVGQQLWKSVSSFHLGVPSQGSNTVSCPRLPSIYNTCVCKWVLCVHVNVYVHACMHELIWVHVCNMYMEAKSQHWMWCCQPRLGDTFFQWPLNPAFLRGFWTWNSHWCGKHFY